MENSNTNLNKSLQADTSIVLPEGKFTPLAEQIREALKQAKDLLDLKGEPTQDQIKLAEKTRKMIKVLRCEIENRRVDLVESSVAYQRNVNSQAKEIKEMCLKAEEKFMAIEEYPERIEKERKEKIFFNRIGEISLVIEPAYNPYTGVSYDEMLATMPDEAFKAMLKGFDDSRKAREEAKRIADEKAAAEREELERLRKEREEREAKENAEKKQRFILQTDRQNKLKQYEPNAAMMALWELTDSQFQTLLENSMAKKAQQDAEREKQRIADMERKALLEKERQERERIEAEFQALKAAEEKKRSEEAKRIADEKAAERKAARAPDREKLIEYANALADVKTPIFKTTDGKEAWERLEGKFSSYLQSVKKEAEEL